jgi:hypothetical protein
MNEKSKYLNEERLSFSVLTGTITDLAVQQSFEIDSLYSAAFNAVYVAKIIATQTKVKKFVPVKNAANILKFFINNPN